MIVKDLIKQIPQDEIINLMLETDNVPDDIDIEDFMKKYSKGRKPIHKKKMISNIHFSIKNPTVPLVPAIDTEKFKAIQRLNRLKKNYRTFLTYLANYESASIKSYESLLLYREYYQFGEKIEDACLYDLKELDEKFHIDDRIEELINNDTVNELTMKEMNEVIEILQKLIPNSYAFEFERWRDILGYRLSSSNLENNKKKLSKFAQLIVYEMLFFGFDEQTKQEEADELHRRKEEIDKIMEGPKEEWDKYFVEWEDPLIDERDPIEEEYKNYVSKRESLYNMLNTYKVLKRDYLPIKEGSKVND